MTLLAESEANGAAAERKLAEVVSIGEGLAGARFRVLQQVVAFAPNQAVWRKDLGERYENLR